MPTPPPPIASPGGTTGKAAPKTVVYPYIPNSAPDVKQAMLREVGLESVEEIYSKEIPDHLRFKRRLAIPGPIPSGPRGTARSRSYRGAGGSLPAGG